MVEQSLPYNNIINYSHRKNIIIRQLFIGIGIVSAILFAAIQLLLGTNVDIVAMAFISLICCALPIILFGLDDICALFIFGLLSKYSFFPLWIKTFMGERIDIGLTSPLLTFEMALVGSLVSCLALLLAKNLPVKTRLFGYRLNNKQILLAGYFATIMGLIFLSLHIIFAPVILSSGDLSAGFGGFGSLVGPLYFGIICLTIISLKPKSNPIHKIFLIAVFVMLVVLSLQTNAKTQFTLAIFAFILTILYFHIKIKAQYIIYSILFITFYFLIFAPIIHLTRIDGFKTAGFSGKISIIENMFNNTSILELDGMSNDIFNYSYYPSIHTFVVDRVEMIQDMDIVAGGISRGNTIGWLPPQWAIESSLPSFITGSKPSISDIDLIAFKAGYYPILTTLNHTIGVFGSAYAMFLWPGLIFIPLALIFLYLLLLRLIVLPKLGYNLFGIYLLSRYVFVFSEQSVQALIIDIIRSIPIDAILVLGILFLVNTMFPNSLNKIEAHS